MSGSTKLTRRQMAGIAAGAVAGSAAAIAVMAQAPSTGQDWDTAARESHKENSAVLAKFDVPQSVEPAFQFKA